MTQVNALLDTAKTNASWVVNAACTNAKSAYAFSGDSLAKIRDAVAPFFAIIAKTACNFISTARTHARTLCTSARVAFNALPKEAQGGVAVGGIALLFAAVIACAKNRQAKA